MADAVRRATAVAASSGSVPLGVFTMYKLFTTELVNGNVDVDSVGPSDVGVMIGCHRSFGIWVKLAGATPDIDVQILQSWDDVAANYVVPDVGGTIVSAITTTAAHAKGVSPVALPWLRFRLKGNAANGADTTADLYFWMQS